MRRTTALNLHALAHDIATGARPVGIRWYNPTDGSRLSPVPVLPEAVHDILCPSTSVNLSDSDQKLVICDACHLAIECPL